MTVDELPEPGIEQLWLEETDRRANELIAGVVTPIPMDEVFAEASASRPRP